MRSSKKYSNVTISKRVDHEIAVPERPPKEPAVCEDCGAVYADRRWVRAKRVTDTAKPRRFQPAVRTLCPACRKKREQLPNGFLYLEGDFLEEHLEEVRRLVRNEADRAADDNPTARIMEWTEQEGKVTVTTTTEHLAQRLGKALSHAYGGDVRYDFSHENKLARVYWRRD